MLTRPILAQLGKVLAASLDAQYLQSLPPERLRRLAEQADAAISARK